MCRRVSARRCSSQQRDVGAVWLWRRVKPWPDPVTRHRCCRCYCCCCTPAYSSRRHIRRWTVVGQDGAERCSLARSFSQPIVLGGSVGRSRRDDVTWLREERVVDNPHNDAASSWSVYLLDQSPDWWSSAHVPNSWLLQGASTGLRETRLSTEATNIDLNLADFKLQLSAACECGECYLFVITISQHADEQFSRGRLRRCSTLSSCSTWHL